MTNPWLQLPDRPDFVLTTDKDAIREYEPAKIEHMIWPSLFPIPYVGNVARAKIVFLQLNPGVEIPPGLNEPIDEDAKFPELLHAHRKNIRQERMEYPFIYLDKKLRFCGGFRYWTNKFSAMLKTEKDYARLANRIACVEFFPYHSKNFRPLKDILPSQKYGFSLVEAAIKRKAKIIIMRGEKIWLNAMPDLKGRYCSLNNPRNVVISEKNMRQKDFAEIQKLLVS